MLAHALCAAVAIAVLSAPLAAQLNEPQKAEAEFQRAEKAVAKPDDPRMPAGSGASSTNSR